MNILDLNPEQFQSALRELAQQGVDTDGLMRQYERKNSLFSGIYDWADQRAADTAEAGRQPLAMGLLSKEAGTTGMDALRSVDVEPLNFIAGLLADSASAIDAPASAARGLVPSGDMAGRALGTAGFAQVGGAAAPRPAGSVGMGGRLYRVERETYENPGEGAVYYSPDRQYVENYKSPDRVLRQASIPKDVIDTTTQDGRASVQSWLLRELDRYKQKEEGGQIRGRADMRDLERILAKDELSFEDTSRALALLDVLDASELGRIPVGASQRRFMDDAGVDAMTIRESDGSLSYAFRSPETAQAYQIGGELSANRSATAGAIALPAARNEAERMARDILEMRAAGRASEVTDAMMAQADPQYMFANTPLPMDEASRMARAREMGFTTGRDRQDVMREIRGLDNPQLVHYTNKDFNEFRIPERQNRKAIWATPDPSVNLATKDNFQNFSDEGVVGIPVMGRMTKRVSPYDFRMAGDPMTPEFPRNVTAEDVAKANSVGADYAEAGLEYAIFDPTNIRSRFARFDPAFSHLANLNAANASPLAGLLALQSEEDRNSALRTLLGGF